MPHGTLLATADQTAGRGRAGRGWEMPPGTAIAMSLLLRGAGAGGPGDAGGGGIGRGAPATGAHGAPSDASPPPLGPSWLPLLAGSAVIAALQPLFPAELGLRVGTKWPNDVHVRDEEDAQAGRPGLKLCGILCEMVTDLGPGSAPGESAVIAGMGINLLIPEWELPTERASSLLASGGDTAGAESLFDPAGWDLADRIVSSVAGELLRLADLARTDPRAARIRVLRDSLTLGSEVRVHLPMNEVVDGRARDLDPDGALVVDLPTGGQLTVTAADIEHLR